MAGTSVRIVGRIGYLGKNRDQRYAEWDGTYGSGNWGLFWESKEQGWLIDFLGVCAIYEDAYFHFLSDNPEILDTLIKDAEDVYDDQESNIESGFNYLIQETDRTHIQDIAIRRCLVRMGRRFEGTQLIRIRQEKGTHKLSTILSPGRLPCHRPSWIVKVERDKKPWWDPNTVEDFYQSNRVLAVKCPPN